MNAETILHNLLYINEHKSCINYLLDEKFGFSYVETSEKVLVTTETVSRNYLFLFIKGEACVTCNQFYNRQFKAGEMVVIPRSSKLRWETDKGTQVLILGFDIPKSPCEKFNFQSLYKYNNEIEYDFQPLPIRYPITTYSDMLIYLLKNQMNCGHMHSIKQQELFLLLRGFYLKKELAVLFYPIIGKDMDFKDFILENYKNVNNTNELVDLSCMGKSAFFVKFKEEFGITAKQWLLKQKVKSVQFELSKPGVTIKDVMAACGFDSPAILNQFCRQHLDSTPGQLIKRYQANIYDSDKKQSPPEEIYKETEY